MQSRIAVEWPICSITAASPASSVCGQIIFSRERRPTRWMSRIQTSPSGEGGLTKRTSTRLLRAGAKSSIVWGVSCRILCPATVSITRSCCLRRTVIGGVAGAGDGGASVAPPPRCPFSVIVIGVPFLSCQLSVVSGGSVPG